MKCHVCLKNPAVICQNCNESGRHMKLEEIKRIKERIEQQKLRYNEALEQITSKTVKQSYNSSSKPYHIISPNKTFQSQISSIARHQSYLIEIKNLKNSINKKSKLLQQYKKQPNQKLTKITQQKFFIQTFKKQIICDFQDKIQQLKKKNKRKELVLKGLSRSLRVYFDQVFGKTLGTLYKLHENYISWEKRALFNIKKVDQLDFLNYNKPIDQMSQSFYEVENIEEVALKKMISQRGLNILFQNILMISIVQKICDLWLPYPINCQINFNESKLITSLENLKICGKQLVDKTKSKQISPNITQNVSEEVDISMIRLSRLRSQEEQFLQLFQADQSISYNNRKFQLDRDIVNYLQVNTEFLSIKHGIELRPLIFFDMNLLNRVTKQFRVLNSYAQKVKISQGIYNVNDKGYNSMLKQIQLNSLIDALQRKGKTLRKSQEFPENSAIPEISQSEQSQQQSHTIKNKINSDQSIDNIFFMQQSLYQMVIPQALTMIKSSQTDNDQFQLLS